jgi:tetratricopeptide (TPR) repeat protein
VGVIGGGHPDLLLERLPEDKRAHLEALLGAGPWGWPSQGAAQVQARRLARRREAPRCLVGRSPLVSYLPGASVATIWVADCEESRLPTPRASLVREALQAWEDAALALPGALPFLWSSLYRVSRQEPAAWELGSVHAKGLLGHAPGALDGRSFGVSFAWLLASQVLGEAPPGDLMGSAAVDAQGRLGEVGALGLKLRAVLELAPGVRRFLVYQGQVEEARSEVEARGGAGRLEIIGASALSEALEVAYPALEARLAKRLCEEEVREEVVEALFHLALSERHQVARWEPVLRAAEHLLERHGDVLGEANARRLGFVCGVAARHQGLSRPTPLPAEGWLGGLAMPLRLRALTHTLQQAADSGEPDPEALVEEARRAMAPLEVSFAEHLRLRGALGRLYAVRGELLEAMRLQEEAAEAWFAHLQPWEASYPLTAWLHLAAALREEEAWGRAMEGVERFRRLGGERGYNRGYLSLAVGRGLCLRGDVDKSSNILCFLADDERAPEPLRVSARRWWTECTNDLRYIEGLEEARSRSASARMALAHLGLWEARRGGASAQDALVRLEVEAPGLSRQLRAHYALACVRASGCFVDEVDYLWRCWPY